MFATLDGPEFPVCGPYEPRLLFPSKGRCELEFLAHFRHIFTTKYPFLKENHTIKTKGKLLIDL